MIRQCKFFTLFLLVSFCCFAPITGMEQRLSQIDQEVEYNIEHLRSKIKRSDVEKEARELAEILTEEGLEEIKELYEEIVEEHDNEINHILDQLSQTFDFSISDMENSDSDSSDSEDSEPDDSNLLGSDNKSKKIRKKTTRIINAIKEEKKRLEIEVSRNKRQEKLAKLKEKALCEQLAKFKAKNQELNSICGIFASGFGYLLGAGLVIGLCCYLERKKDE